MKYLNAVVAAAIAFGAAPAFADQLAANAGLSPAEAAGLSLTEIAQAKFNRDTRGDDRHVFVVPGTGGNHDQLAAVAGLSPAEASRMTLAEIYVAKINREARGDERQAAGSGTAIMGSRSLGGPNNHTQLAASAGIDPADAAGMSLADIAAAKFARDTDANH